MSKRKDLPAEGIQVAPVFVEKWKELENRDRSLKDYAEIVANIQLKLLQDLRADCDSAWKEILAAYDLKDVRGTDLEYTLSPEGRLTVERKEP